MIRHRWLTLAALAAAGAALACSGDAPAPLRPLATDTPALDAGTAATPVFLTLDPNAPPLVSTTVSFYAVKGQDREAWLYYMPAAGETDSSKFLRFRVRKKSLCNYVDGTPIANGDSVLITITVTDQDKQIVNFQPAGLRFCKGRPAKLNLWYLEADHDFDQDGDIDGADAIYETNLRIWRQEGVGQPWIRMTTTLTVSLDETEADIKGFTNYVVAY